MTDKIAETLKNQKGYSLVEIVFAALLLALFGITTFTLVNVGGNSYSRIMEERANNSNLRSAVSYISMRVRQYNAVDAVAVENGGAGPVLTLSEDIEGSVCKTYVYVYGGYLRELMADADIPFDPAGGFEIVPVDGLSLSFVEGEESAAVSVGVWIDSGSGGRAELSSLVRVCA